MTGIVNPFPVVSLSDTMVQQAISGGFQYVPQVELYVGAGGYVIDFSISHGAASVFADDVWFIPKKVAFGSSLPGAFWARLTVNSGTVPTDSAINTWLPVTATAPAVVWTWKPANAQIALVINANVTIEIATDAGGVTIVSSRAGIPVHVEVIAEGTPHVITPPPVTQLRSAVFGVAGERLGSKIVFDKVGRLSGLDSSLDISGSYGDSGENATKPRHWYYPLANHFDGTEGVFGWLFATLKSGAVAGSATGVWIQGQAGWWLPNSTTGTASAFLDIKVSTTNSDAGLIGTYLNAELSYSHSGPEGPPAPPADFWTNFNRSYEIP